MDPVSIPENDENRLANEPTEFLRSRANDKINWQPWSPALLETAEAEQKPIFAFVTSGKYPNSTAYLDTFSNPENGFSQSFNEAYVCSLVDIEAHPEISNLATVLSLEIRKPLSFPFLLWMSHEGNPVAWLPIKLSDEERFIEIVEQSNSLVLQTWNDSPAYFVENSRSDNERRRSRSAQSPREEKLVRSDFSELLVSATSVLSSFYDPASKVIDNTGGLVPTGLLRYFANVRSLPELPNYLSDRCDRISQSITELLASKPITDPLDNGVYVSRKNADWSIPRFTKALETQSEIAIAHALVYANTGNEASAQHALKTLAFAKNEFGANDEGYGVYRSLAEEKLTQEVFFWTLSELESLLTEEEFEALAVSSLISANGNISAGVDPKREYFRKNILGNFRTTAEVAESLSLTVEEARQRLQSAKKKLRFQQKEKAAKLNPYVSEQTRITELNAAHALALYKCGQLLSRPELFSEGRATLNMLKQQHYDSLKGLWRIPPKGSQRGIKARGRDYSALIGALLEAYRVEMKAADLVWAETLSRESVRVLADEEGLLLEAAPAELLGPFLSYDNLMTLGDSTWGTILGAFEHLDRITVKHTLASSMEAIKQQLHDSVVRNPMNHTDYLSSLLVPVTNCVALIHGDLKDPNLKELHQILLDPQYQGITLIRPEIMAKSDFIKFASAPDHAGVTLYRSERKLGTAINPEELRSLLTSTLEPR